MKLLVTGSAGHLGEALVRQLRADGHEVTGLDRKASPFTDRVGDIGDRALLARGLRGIDAVLHAATLHKPHMATHPMADFVATNVAGTLALLEVAVQCGVGAFVYTSTTSAFGAALNPGAGAPAAWIDESVAPVARNVYGATKVAAEDLCQVVHRRHGLPCIVLRTSRFFPEDDDDAATRTAFAPDNVQVNELTHRRVELQDVVDAHVRALERAPAIGFGRYIVSATTPFTRADVAALRGHADTVLRERVPAHVAPYAQRGWRVAPDIDRVYDNRRARDELGWAPRTDFGSAVAALAEGRDWRSPLTRAVGRKPYHDRIDWTDADGPFPVLR
ncbi:MAG: NAD(P)-dependent oxidoreductase [Rubrivivax sp.]